MDGHKQRQALSAAERALKLLSSPETAGRAQSAASKAEELDQIALFAGLAEAVAQAAREVQSDGGVNEATRGTLLTVVGPGPLEPLVAQIPGS